MGVSDGVLRIPLPYPVHSLPILFPLPRLEVGAEQIEKRVVNVSHLTFLSLPPYPAPSGQGQAEGMNGVEGSIFTLMAAYVVFIDTAGSVLVVVEGGRGRGAWEATGRRGLGEEAEGDAAGGWGGGERREPGAWGEGGRNNIVVRAHQVLAVSPNKKEESASLGGWGRGGGSHRLLQPRSLSPLTPALLWQLKRGGAPGISP